MLTNELVLERIGAMQPQALASSETGYDGILNVETTREQLVALLTFLRDDEELNYHFLTTLNAIHYPDNQGRELGVVYHLHNWPQNRRIRVKVWVPAGDEHVPSITSLWPSSNWMERQEYDFFGILFDGHPDLRRILNVDDMDVFPLRKEYRLEDGTRTDKDDRFFGRDGHEGRSFD
ncbi:MAG: NADH-quinone oxidoreductase subunit C [Bacteroidota bacterium]